MKLQAIFGITAHTRVLIRRGGPDGRLGFKGLKDIVANVIHEDPMCSHFFVFCNAARNPLHVLGWHHGGLYLGRPRV